MIHKDKNVLIKSVLIIIIFTFTLNIFLNYNNEASDMPTTYSINLAKSVDFTVQNGRSINSSDLKYVTQYTNGILLEKGYLLYTKYVATIVIITGIPLSVVNPLLGILFACIFLLAIFAFMNYVSSSSKIDISNSAYILVTGFVLLGSSYLTLKFMGISNEIICLILIVIIFYLLLEKNDGSNVIKIAIAIFLSFIIPVIYPTPALTFFIMLTSLFIFQKIKHAPILSATYVLAYTTFWIAYLFYVTPNQFLGLITTLTTAFNPSLQVNHVSSLSPYLIQTPVQIRTLNIIDGIITIIPVVYYFFFRKHVYPKNNILDKFLLGLFISLGFMGIMFLSNGIQLVIQRVAGWGTFIAMLVVPVILVFSKGKNNFINGVIIAAIIISVITTISVFPNTIVYSQMSIPEDSGGAWLANNSYQKDMVYTDFRLMGSIGFREHYRVIGLVPSEPDQKLINSSLSVFYGDSASEAMVRYGAKYLFLSERMSMNPPGVVGAGIVLKPVDNNILYKFNNQSYFNKIYENNQVVTYYFSRNS